MKTIAKYLSIYSALFKASLISDLEYRANFFSKFISDVFWYLAQIVTFEVIYQHTNKIGDWGIEQMRIFLGVLFVVDALYMMAFSENMDNFSEKIAKGDLDLLLAKPINSQFMISLQRANTSMFANLALSIAWLGYALFSYPETHIWQALWLFVLIPLGVTIVYCLRFFLASTSVILVRSQYLQFLWYQIYRLGNRPDSMYHPALKFALLTILPVGLVASVPTRIAIDTFDIRYFILPFIIVPILLYLTHKFWNYSLKFYSSASS